MGFSSSICCWTSFLTVSLLALAGTCFCWTGQINVSDAQQRHGMTFCCGGGAPLSRLALVN